MADKHPITGEVDTKKVEAQERRCQRWIEGQGHVVAAIVRENDKSAWVAWKRPKFNDTVDRVRAGEADGIISSVTDRLTRHPKEMEVLIDIAEEGERLKGKSRGPGVLITTLDGEFDLTTDIGRHQARGAVANARFETERKGKRHRDANEERLAEGEPPQGGGRPFGYEADKITIRQDEADRIKDATERFLAGAHLRTLVREWNEAGVKTVRGKQWTRGTITGLLERWRNAGLREHEGVPVIKAAWDPIVTREQVEAVRHLRKQRQHEHERGTTLIARKHLLSGIATCRKCGQGLQADGTVKNGIRFDTYRCRGGAAELRCSTSIRRDVVDERVLDEAASLISLPSPRLLNTKAAQRASALRAERAEIEGNLATLRAADFSKEFAAVMLRASGFQERLNAIDAELERLSESDALAALITDLRPLEARHVATFTRPEGNKASVRARLDALREQDLGKLRRVLRSLVEVEIHPWTGTGKPSAATAKARVIVAERHQDVIREDEVS